jgi:hypothetical protein
VGDQEMLEWGCVRSRRSIKRSDGVGGKISGVYGCFDTGDLSDSSLMYINLEIAHLICDRPVTTATTKEKRDLQLIIQCC